MVVQASTDLMTVLGRNETVLMDGALGTELERRQLPIEGAGWSALAVRDHGEVIRDIHREYIEAGARLHIVNSFALARHVLEPIGLGADFEALNRRAVELFDEAVVCAGADRSQHWAAGSLSTFCANSDRSLLPQGAALVNNCHDQAQLLFDAGVDLFALEMLFDCDVSLAMLQAVVPFKLPVILGFTCEWDEDSSQEDNSQQLTIRQGMGRSVVTLDQVLKEIVAKVDPQNLILSIMHSEIDATDAALELLHRYWSGPVAIYPNSGDFVDLHLQFDGVCSEAEFEQAAQRWLQAGVQIVGGCCGIGPAHISRLGGKLVHS
jgi:S-methylmethionine-dependent homocysteine/selenocysteine methylase